MRALGLMSGTSLDGIDAALVQLSPNGDGYDVDVERFATVPFPAPLRHRLVEAMPPHAGATGAVAQLHADLGVAFASFAKDVVADAKVDFAATHGLTVYHDGERSVTLQIARPYELRDALRASVVWDFRSADCAVGGHGAPLVPFVDALLLSSPSEDRVAVNVGGICNMTILPRRAAAAEEPVAFDVGPGVMLLDAFVRERTGEPFDRDGRYTAAGSVDELLAAEMLADPYFAEEPPKSTGRERFGQSFLDRFAGALSHLPLEDGCATLAAVTVRPLARAIQRYAPQAARAILSGGGARNAGMMAMLRNMLGDRVRVERSEVLGIDADAKEAIAFAVLGYETLRGRPANLPRVTGSHARTVLGSIVPYELDALLRRVAAEVDAARS